MASKPPLGLSLADILGASTSAPKVSKGQMILGILGDALSGATGGTPTFGAMQYKQRQAEQENADWGRKLLAQEAIKQQFPEQSPMERDATAWMRMTPEQRAAYKEAHPPAPMMLPYGATIDPGSTPTSYSAPTADNLPLVEKPEDASKLSPGTRFKMPDGRIGTVPGGVGGNAGGVFPRSYPNVGPYRRY